MSSSLAELAAPHEATTMSAENVCLIIPVWSTTTSVMAVPAGFVLKRLDRRVRQQGDGLVLERWTHAQHLSVGFRVHDTWEAVAVAVSAHTRSNA